MTSSSYAAAGVDVEAGEHAVSLMKEWIARAQRPEVVGGFGGFAGLFDVSAIKGFERPLLATSTDGVGTKVAVAQAMDVHNTIGIDLVAMVIDDIVVCGAEPLFMTDYIATGKVIPERVAAIVSGIAQGCAIAGCALVGGETAEHPGLLDPDEYDVAGAGTGVVDAENVLGAHRVRPGDVLIAMASSGLHSNGYSLARHVLLGSNGPGLGEVGEELLIPTRIYAQDCLALARDFSLDVHAMSHITGGGIAANIARVIGEDITVEVDRATWSPQPIFDLIATTGNVERGEMERTFNMGIGMVAVLPESSANAALELLKQRGVDAWVCGSARERRAEDISDAEAKGGNGGVTMVRGDYLSSSSSSSS